MGITYEQAMQALRNADASGDKEDAARLAEIANNLKNSKPAEPVYTADIPTPMTKPPLVSPKKPHSEIGEKIALALTGGQYNNMQDVIYNGEPPEDSTLGQMGQILNGFHLEGLTGIGQIGQIGSAGTKLASKIPEEIPKAISKAKEFVSPVSNKIGEIASNVGKKAKELPGDILGYTSGMVNPKSVNFIAKMEREGNPEILKAINEGAGTPVVNRMVYNYAREHGLDHEDAAKAVDMVRGHPLGLGSWDIYDKKLQEGLAQGKELWEIFPKYEDYSKLNLPEQIKLARQAGVDMSTYLPQKSGNKVIAGLEGLRFGPDIYHATKSIADLMKGAANLKLLPLAMAQSPKVVGNVAKTAGKAARLADKASVASSKYIAPTVDKYLPRILDSTVTPQMIGAGADITEAKGGRILPLSLRHPYYHERKKI